MDLVCETIYMVYMCTVKIIGKPAPVLVQPELSFAV